MMTSSNGHIFHVAGPLCGEFAGHRWIPLTKASDAELWCCLDLRLNKRLSKQSRGWWFETPSRSLGRQCNEWNIIFGNLPCVLEHCNWTDYPMLLFSNLLVPNLPFSGGEFTKSQDTVQGLLLLTGVTLIPTWISNHMSSKAWGESYSSIKKFNVYTVDVWERISNFTPPPPPPHFVMDAITYPCDD